jgi:hypothetical protein
MTHYPAQTPSHATRFVSVLALGALASVGCNRGVSGVDNGSSTTTTAASSGAETPVNTQANGTADANATTSATTPNALVGGHGTVSGTERNGQVCNPATDSDSGGMCVCRNFGSDGNRWACAMPISGPLRPPELA